MNNMGGAGEATEQQLLIISDHGCQYGIDAEQIAGLFPAETVNSGVGFRRLLALPEDNALRYRKAMQIKRRSSVPILIPEPDEVAAFTLPDLQPLPDALARAAKLGVWALALRGKRIIVLIDFYKNELFQRLSCAEKKVEQGSGGDGEKKNEQ